MAVALLPSAARTGFGLAAAGFDTDRSVRARLATTRWVGTDLALTFGAVVRLTGVLPATFLATAFLTAVFLAAVFLATAFLAAGFVATVFLVIACLAGLRAAAFSLPTD